MNVNSRSLPKKRNKAEDDTFSQFKAVNTFSEYIEQKNKKLKIQFDEDSRSR